MPQERHQVTMERRMSALPRKFAEAPRRPRPQPAPEPVVEAVPVPEPGHVPGEPITLGQLRTFVAMDPAASGDNAVVFGTVDGHGRIVHLELGPAPEEQTAAEKIDALSVREQDKPTTLVITDGPPADADQDDLTAMLHRGMAAQGARLGRPGVSVPRR